MLLLKFLLIIAATGCGMAEDGLLTAHLYESGQFTPEDCKQVEKNGFDLVVIDEKSPDANLKALDLCQANGLKGIVVDSQFKLMKNDEEGFEANFDAIIRNYSNHPAFWGCYLSDKPDSSAFVKLSDVNRYLLEKDSTHTGFINLLPISATSEQTGKTSYEHYVDEYLRMVHPRLLSFKSSILKDEDNRQLFQNLEIIRRQGIKHKTPFSYTPESSGNNLRWQVNTALAYGARGILYSNAINPANTTSSKKINTLISKINSELKKLSPILMTLHSAAVYHTSPVPEGSKALPENGLITKIKGGEFIIGHFTSDNSLKYAMIVNRSLKDNSNAVIRFNQEVVLYEVNPSTGRERKIRAKDEYGATIWKTKIKPGHGRLVRIELKLDLPVNNWEDKQEFRPRVMLNPSNQFANVILGEIGEQLYNEGMNMYHIAEQVQKYLQQDGRVDVFMTRSSQIQKTTLREETSLTRSLNCDLLLAMHSDATGTASPGGGTWTFYWDDDGRKLGESVNSNLVEAIRSFYPEVLDRGVRTHWIRLWVIHEAGCPAALTEFLFHSNPKERELLKDPKCQDIMVKAVARGILEYLGLE